MLQSLSDAFESVVWLRVQGLAEDVRACDIPILGVGSLKGLTLGIRMNQKYAGPHSSALIYSSPENKMM